jgi:3-methyladenine DNA glycosylase AlkC
MPEDSHPAQLKDWFDEKRYQSLARELAALAKPFRKKVFLQMALNGLEQRTLMQRLHQCAVAVDAALPGSFREKVEVLHTLAPRIEHGFVAIFLSDFVASFGLHDFDFSLEALCEFTKHGSAEFAVRPFLMADQKRALKTMRRWAEDDCEHVRRLASEGSRPRLPWGMRLPALVADPSPSAPILEALKGDEALYVRKSVSNHLNDITKDHPEWVVERLEGWDLRDERQSWIAKHACRTLIKRGHPRALQLFGFAEGADVDAMLTVSPKSLSLGQRLRLSTTVTSTARKPQRLVIDYVIHYVKASGGSAAKVFKWTETELKGGDKLELSKTQEIRDFTTRKHYPGNHKVELQINGQRVASAAFDLS